MDRLNLSASLQGPMLVCALQLLNLVLIGSGQHELRLIPSKDTVQLFLSLLSTRFPSAGLSVAHFCAGWLLDWSLAAKWARLLITQQTAAYPTHRRIKRNQGWAGLKR